MKSRRCGGLSRLPALILLVMTLAMLPGLAPAQTDFEQVEFRALAKLRDDLPPLNEGLIWRIYTTQVDAKGLLPVIHESRDSELKVKITPGNYVVSAAYGRAVVSQKVSLEKGPVRITINMNAGAIKLNGMVGLDQKIDPADVTFSLFPADQDRPLIENIIAGTYMRVPAGDYRVKSAYGHTNAKVEAEVRIEPGKLSDVDVFHRAATVTLKLVRKPGGKAQVNTSWELFDREGEPVAKINSSLFRLVLAEGGYTAIATQEGQSYRRDFVVENGINRDVEVLVEP